MSAAPEKHRLKSPSRPVDEVQVAVDRAQAVAPSLRPAGGPPTSALACPLTKQPLFECDLREAEPAGDDRGRLVPRKGPGPAPVGRTPRVLLRADGRCAYPIVEGIPILLAPERLVRAGDGPLMVDLSLPQYAEAYEEMDVYTSAAEASMASLDGGHSPARLAAIADLPEADREVFPEPPLRWLDAKYETAAQRDAYRHLAPVAGRTVLQIGGKGQQAVTLLLGGAAEAWVVSPMVRELIHARALAGRLGFGGRLRCAAGIAEEIPLGAGEVDAIYSISTHHTVTPLAYPECARALSPGGAMAAVEPWRAPLYRLGTKILGKRDPQVHCRPLTPSRIEPFLDAFDRAEVILHGSLLRYPMLALWKAGLEMSLATAWHVSRVDDAVASLVPGLRRWGSCAALLGTTAS